jgi:RNA polymerase sigma factor (sigma-70 family)
LARFGSFAKKTRAVPRASRLFSGRDEGGYLMSVLLRNEQTSGGEQKAARPRPSDEELLRRFVADRSDLAFAQLVTTYGPLVMAVCRRVLAQEQDAEDAFQATFLVLARKAASLRRARSLPAWLHKTAYRVALRARAANVRRREQPLEGETMIATETLSQLASDHDQSALDEELNRLPDIYRLPLFLCCVEGVSRNEAADRLGWSLGSLKGRLERGRQLLRRRLMLRRVSLGVALALFVRTQQTAQAAVAPSLVASTVQAGMQYAAGQSVVGYASQNAFSLANGSLHVMSLTTSKVVLCSLLVIGLLTWGTSWLPAPAIADGDEFEGQIVTLQVDAVGSPNPSTLVAFLADDEADRSRRSPEAETGSRRSPEAETDVRPAAETESGSRRSVEGESGRTLDAFRPQTEREAALYRMILGLQREVAELRRSVQARDGGGRFREGDAPRTDSPVRSDANVRRDGSAERDTPVGDDAPYRREGDGGQRENDAHVSKFQKTFRTYDKNGDNSISFDERLAMKSYEVTGERLFNERLYHLAEDMDRDGGVSLDEFAAARTRKAESWRQALLVNADVDKRLITVKFRGGEGGSASGTQSIRVEPKAVIVVKGREAKLDGLIADQPIFVFMAHDEQSAIGLTQR